VLRCPVDAGATSVTAGRSGDRAGYEPWPRLFHNMRTDCTTDWAEALHAHVVAHDQTQWLGHSPLVAAKHYLQTRDAHFEVATRGGARMGSEIRAIQAARD